MSPSSLSRPRIAVAVFALAVASIGERSPARAQDLLDLVAPRPAAPPEVASFVKRLAGCNHWSGEVATDPERGEQIAQARFRLRCNTVEQDEGRLRARYANSPAAIDALDNAGSGEE